MEKEKGERETIPLTITEAKGFVDDHPRTDPYTLWVIEQLIAMVERVAKEKYEEGFEAGYDSGYAAGRESDHERCSC